MNVSYPILNVEYQGGATLESFATRIGRGEYNTDDEAFNMADGRAHPDASGYCDWTCAPAVSRKDGPRNSCQNNLNDPQIVVEVACGV